MVLLELVEKISPRNPPLRRTGNELYSAESPESNHTCPLWNQFLIPILLAFHSEHVRPRRVRRKGIFSAHLFNGRLSHPLLPEGEKSRDGPMARWPGIVSLLLGMGASLGSYIHYIRAYGLPMEAYHYHFKGIYNSVNYFPHIHTSKTYLYRVGSLLGFERALGNMDDGRVFVDVIPGFYPYVTLFSTLLVILLSLFLIPEIVDRWEGRNKTGISILSVLSFNSIIKCLSDGGPFAYDFLVGIGVIFLLHAFKESCGVKRFFETQMEGIFMGIFGYPIARIPN